MMTVKEKFDEIYNKLSTPKNYVQTKGISSDYWSIDRYVVGNMFSYMSNGGYCKGVGKLGDNGRALWAVTMNYGPRGEEFELSGIEESDFINLTFKGF